MCVCGVTVEQHKGPLFRVSVCLPLITAVLPGEGVVGLVGVGGSK